MHQKNNRSIVLFAHASPLLGGANQVLLRLIERLDRSRYQPICVIPDVGPLAEELKRLETEYQVVDIIAASQSALRQAICRLQLCLKTLHRRPVLLHANEMAYRTTASLTGAKRICHIHHPNVEEQFLAWSLKRTPDAIITPSHYMRERIELALQRCNMSAPVHAVWNPINTDRFRPVEDKAKLRSQLNIDPTSAHVSIVGALAPHKGHFCFLKMACEILKQRRNVQFHIIGGDMGRHLEYAASLRQLAAELKMTPQVRFWGFVDDDRVRDLMAASDLFVLPTTEEGFGIVLAESQACGVPVLCSNIQPLDEVVDHGRTGVLLNPQDYHAFAQQAVCLLDSQSNRQLMGKAGRQWVEQRFSQSVFVDRISQLYEQHLPAQASYKAGKSLTLQSVNQPQ